MLLKIPFFVCFYLAFIGKKLSKEIKNLVGTEMDLISLFLKQKIPKLVKSHEEAVLKSFKEFLKKEEEPDNFEWYSFEQDDCEIHIFYNKEENNILKEAKHKGLSLGGTYSAKIHQSHSDVGQKHLHVYLKNNQLFSINIDGTAHDRSHGTKIPNKVANGIRKKFPNFSLPVDNLIESAPEDIQILTKISP